MVKFYCNIWPSCDRKKTCINHTITLEHMVDRFHLYQLCSKISFELEGDFTSVEAQQIIFHCIFGTHKEDLSILERITKLGIWNTREKFGKKFIKMTMCDSSINFYPITLSKLPVFGGRRILLIPKKCIENEHQYYEIEKHK